MLASSHLSGAESTFVSSKFPYLPILQIASFLTTFGKQMTHQKQNIWSAGWRHWWENDSKRLNFRKTRCCSSWPLSIRSNRIKSIARKRRIGTQFVFGNTLTLSSRYKCRPITKIYERAKGLEAWVDIESIELSSDRKSLRIKFK